MSKPKSLYIISILLLLFHGSFCCFGVCESKVFDTQLDNAPGPLNFISFPLDACNSLDIDEDTSFLFASHTMTPNGLVVVSDRGGCNAFFKQEGEDRFLITARHCKGEYETHQIISPCAYDDFLECALDDSKVMGVVIPQEVDVLITPPNPVQANDFMILPIPDGSLTAVNALDIQVYGGLAHVDGNLFNCCVRSRSLIDENNYDQTRAANIPFQEYEARISPNEKKQYCGSCSVANANSYIQVHFGLIETMSGSGVFYDHDIHGEVFIGTISGSSDKHRNYAFPAFDANFLAALQDNGIAVLLDEE